MAIQNVKGTHDVLSNESKLYQRVESLMCSVAELFAYKEVRVPVMEYSDLFIRGVGKSSDIVRKEMYTFLDHGDRSITLRPEFTAGIMRMLIQNKVLAVNELPVKSYYLGPVFRYDRPQLGRYRQFNQFGIESVGHDSPLNDCEVISLAYTILCSLGLDNVVIRINTLGDEESRNNYREALKEYFGKHLDHMCSDCKERYELNPLRILDCKVPSDQEIVKDAPLMNDYLSDKSRERFAYVLKVLEELEIPYEVDTTLVRGLDYYSETVFEFHYTSKAGNNYGAIGGGGHYGHLVRDLGGPDVPGIGLSFGIERLVSVIKDDQEEEIVEEGPDFYIMPMGEKAHEYGLLVADDLRVSGYATDFCFDDVKLGNMFKRAERKNAKYALIIGDNEVENDEVVIKDLKSQEQKTIQRSLLLDYVDELFDEHECGCHKDDGEHHCCHENKEEEHHCCCHNKEEK